MRITCAPNPCGSWAHPWFSADGADDPVFGGDYGELVCFLRDGDRVFETYQTTDRGNEAMMASYPLMDLTVFGRQEAWEDSPQGWPRRSESTWRRDGRPVPQWTRPGATPVT